MWKYERKGSYSVKSGYSVLTTNNVNDLIGGVHEIVLKYLWALTVPRKVKKFLWRACCDAPKPGGPLTTRQPAEYKWRSGYPTPL